MCQLLQLAQEAVLSCLELVLLRPALLLGALQLSLCIADLILQLGVGLLKTFDGVRGSLQSFDLLLRFFQLGFACRKLLLGVLVRLV